MKETTDLVKEIIGKNLIPNKFSYKSLISGYFNEGKIKGANPISFIEVSPHATFILGKTSMEINKPFSIIRLGFDPATSSPSSTFDSKW